MTIHLGDQTGQVTLPLQSPPVEMLEPPVATEVPPDHVRSHGRSCWWDVAECRWVCRGY
jgi:hypothetical protein